MRRTGQVSNATPEVHQISFAVEPAFLVVLSSSLAAVLTGFGSLRPGLGKDKPSFGIGTAEAVASGLMLGAAHLLMSTGLDRDDLMAVLGAVAGVAFTFWVQFYAGTRRPRDDRRGSDRGSRPATKLLLQIALHSASEGVAIGVAFLVDTRLGIFVAATLAVHNIAEGFALAPALRLRGASPFKASGLCVATKLSQPLVALVTFALGVLFERAVVDQTLAALLGFASGCLVFLVLTELLPDAYCRASRRAIALLTSSAAGTVVLFRGFLL